MDNFKKATIEIKVNQVIEALKENNMNGFFARTCAEAVDIAKSLVKEGDVISHGGSVTLKEAGFTELFNSGKYNYLDRSKATTPEEMQELYRKCFSTDVFFTSSNAVTLKGELYNVDGNSNRVAPMLFGPDKVVVVVGVNKLVNDIDEAVKRVKKIAAPANCIRLEKDTYCRKNGKCVTTDNKNGDFCAGCNSDERICCNYTVMSKQRNKGRVNVIIINQELGY